jgi:phosphomethylpyrimidine synthase
MTILEEALKGNITDDFIQVANEEKVNINTIIKTISKGQTVILKRINSKPVGIGFPFRTKINVNMGTSTSLVNIDTELEKVKIAEKFGADTLSDLSMGGNIDLIRKKILNTSTVPITN